MIKLNDPNLPPDHPLNKMDPANFKGDQHQFSPKLDFAERCAIYAFRMVGVAVPQLATAFGVDRRTIARITSSVSNAKYRSVKRELERLGEVEFKRTYMTEIYTARVAAAQDAPKNKISTRRLLNEPHSSIPSPRANKKAGLNVISTENTKHSHRIFIEYKNDGEAFDSAPAGWYYRDEDSEEPNSWFRTNDPAGWLTSYSCYKCLLEELVDITPTTRKNK